jgi:hypothetical protein
MWKVLPLLLVFLLILHAAWLLTKGRKDNRFQIYLSTLVVSWVLYFFLINVLEPKDAVKALPLIFILVLIAIISYANFRGNEKEPVAGFSSLAILGVGGILYYMIVFLDYEILGTYTLRSIEKYNQEILAAKADLDSLNHYREQVMREVETAKMEINVQLEKIAVYTADAARTKLEMQSHLAKQKEIEKTIANFDAKLSQITQDLIFFSFLVGEKPMVIGGGIVDEFKHDLENITHSLGTQLKFDGDSLLTRIQKRRRELEKEFDKRQEQLQKSKQENN